MAPGSPAGWLRWERRRVRGAAWASEPMAEVEGSTSRPGTRTNLPARRRPRSLCFPPPPEPRARAGPANPASAHPGPASRRVSLSLPLSSRCPSARRDHVPVLAAAASLRALPRGGRNDRWTHVCRLLPAQSREARLLRGPAPPPLPLFLRAGPAPAPLCLLLGLPTGWSWASTGPVCSWGSPRSWSCTSSGPRLLLGLLPTPAPASGPWTSLSLEWPSPGSARLLLPVIQDKCHWLGAALSDPQSEGTGLPITIVGCSRAPRSISYHDQVLP